MKNWILMTMSCLTRLLLLVLCSSSFTNIVIVVQSYECKDVGDCGCQFTDESGTFIISMKGISYPYRPYFTGVKDANEVDWTYSIDPCYGFNLDTGCQDVAMCRINTDNTNHIPVSSPDIERYGDYEEGKPLQVIYKTHTHDNVVRQLIINLNYGADEKPSFVFQSKLPSNVHQFTVNVTSWSLRPNATQPSSSGSSSGSGGLSIGSVIVIIFFVLVVVYLVTGMLFMKYRRGASRKEVIPNVDFWSSLPGLVKDGCVFSSKKVNESCGGLCRDFHREGYDEIST